MIDKPINVFEYENLAPSYLSRMAWDYYRGGSGDELTLKSNRQAYQKYLLRPRILVDVSQRDLSVSILGQSLSLPILVAPMGFQGLAHPDGEIATAKAAATLGSLMILSTFSTQSLESVSAQKQNTPQWFQLYIHRDRGLTRALVERAEAAGYSGLCLTVDAPILGKRERDARNQFTLPPHLQLANLVTLTHLNIPEVEGGSGLFTYFSEQIDPSLTWKDVEWLQSITRLPILVKGILRPDDALKALEHGVKGVIVSNHGGRQLDGAISSLEALPEIVEAVNNEIEVLIDGGIRRGTDILKALALGAKAVLIGRPVLWGLAVAGEAGVYHVLDLLRSELEVAMTLSGCPSLDRIDRSLIRESTQG